MLKPANRILLPEALADYARRFDSRSARKVLFDLTGVSSLMDICIYAMQSTTTRFNEVSRHSSGIGRRTEVRTAAWSQNDKMKPGFRGDDANAVDIGNNNIGTSFSRPTSHTYMCAPASSMHALRGVSAAFACRNHSFTSETLTDSRGQSVVSHRIEVLLRVISAPLAHREHAGTGRAKLLIFATFDLS